MIHDISEAKNFSSYQAFKQPLDDFQTVFNSQLENLKLIEKNSSSFPLDLHNLAEIDKKLREISNTLKNIAAQKYLNERFFLLEVAKHPEDLKQSKFYKRVLERQVQILKENDGGNAVIWEVYQNCQDLEGKNQERIVAYLYPNCPELPKQCSHPHEKILKALESCGELGLEWDYYSSTSLPVIDDLKSSTEIYSEDFTQKKEGKKLKRRISSEALEINMYNEKFSQKIQEKRSKHKSSLTIPTGAGPQVELYKVSKEHQIEIVALEDEGDALSESIELDEPPTTLIAPVKIEVLPSKNLSTEEARIIKWIAWQNGDLKNVFKSHTDLRHSNPNLWREFQQHNFKIASKIDTLINQNKKIFVTLAIEHFVEGNCAKIKYSLQEILKNKGYKIVETRVKDLNI